MLVAVMLMVHGDKMHPLIVLPNIVAIALMGLVTVGYKAKLSSLAGSLVSTFCLLQCY